MENNLVHLVKSYFTDNVISSLSSHVGEDQELVKSGVNAAIPSLLLGLQSGSGEGLGSILNKSKHLFQSFDLEHVMGNFFGNSGGEDNTQFESNNLLSSIFGDKLSGIISTVSNLIGVKSESIKSIFGAAIPAVISGITNKGSNWDVGSITQLLNGQKSDIAAALPAGLGLGAFGSLFAKAETPVELETPKASINTEHIRRDPPLTHTHETVQETKKGAGLWWLLIPLLLLLLWFLFGKSCKGDKNPVGADTVETIVDTNVVVIQDTATVVREYIDVQLPNGTTVKGYPSGIEESLIAFLQTDYKSLSDDELKDKWFNFDNLNFETNTAKVLPESQKQLENIAAILSLFPDAKIKIGGYTDKTGDESYNKKLSQERADAVKNYLSAQNLGTQVVGAEGYGSEFAKAAADAPESERVNDRKVAVSVRK